MVNLLRMALATVCMTLTSIGGCKSELKLQPGDELEHASETWSVLEIRSIMTSVDPFRLHLLMDAKGSSLYARLPADPQVFTVDAHELVLLSLHCPASR